MRVVDLSVRRLAHLRIRYEHAGKEVVEVVDGQPGGVTLDVHRRESSSHGRRLIALGDAFHVPAQLAHPRWGSAPDENPAAVLQARARLLDELLAPDTYGFAIHFGDQPFGRVVRDAAGVPRGQPVPTEVLAPPPC